MSRAFLLALQPAWARLRDQARRLPWWGRALAGFAALTLLAALALLLAGGQPQPSGLATAPALASPASLALDATLKLGLVLSLIYGCAWLLKRWRGPLSALPARRLEILETRRLSPRQALHLVRVGEQTYLIGAADGGLSLLAQVDEQPAAAAAAASQRPVSFAELLRQS